MTCLSSIVVSNIIPDSHYVVLYPLNAWFCFSTKPLIQTHLRTPSCRREPCPFIPEPQKRSFHGIAMVAFNVWQSLC